MTGFTSSWQFWAILSAVFAALTAIFAKVGVAHVNADFATLIRTLVVVALLVGIVAATGQFQSPSEISGRTWTFLALSGLATGASWLCYFRALKLGHASQVAPIDKLSVVLVAVFGVLFLGEKLSTVELAGRRVDCSRRGAGRGQGLNPLSTCPSPCQNEPWMAARTARKPTSSRRRKSPRGRSRRRSISSRRRSAIWPNITLFFVSTCPARTRAGLRGYSV